MTHRHRANINELVNHFLILFSIQHANDRRAKGRLARRLCDSAQGLCGLDEEGHVPAIPLNGRWDHREGNPPPRADPRLLR